MINRDKWEKKGEDDRENLIYREVYSGILVYKMGKIGEANISLKRPSFAKHLVDFVARTHESP